MKRMGFWIAVVLAGLLVASFACGRELTTEEIQGLLQAMEGKEMVIRLEDGSTVRITVENQQAATQAQELVGTQVNARVRIDDNRRELAEVRRRAAEDQHFTGVIESIGEDTWTIGGRNFRVDGSTILDGGLQVGVTAEVEFIALADGTALAIKIETDVEDEQFTGIIESMGEDQWLIGGRTFQVTPGTRLDEGLAVGVEARVEFVTQQDGTMVAIEIETDEDDDADFTGAIESMGAEGWVIGGRTFRVNAATHLSHSGRGLVVGAMVRVEFITLSDGTLVATEIQALLQRFSGLIESMGQNQWVVGGRTFAVTGSARIDDGLQVGVKARVRFVEMANGTLTAIRIDRDRSGPGGGGSDDSQADDSQGRGGGSDDSQADDSQGRSGGNDDSQADDSQGRSGGNDDQQGAEDLHLTGTIESIGTDAWVIGGETFKVDQGTVLDDGLAVGVEARVKYVAPGDGSKLATKIETDASQ